MKKCHSPKNTKPTKENENEYLKKLIADELHWKQDKYKWLYILYWQDCV